jgi:hypothetical protein
MPLFIEECQKLVVLVFNAFLTLSPLFVEICSEAQKQKYLPPMHETDYCHRMD